MLINMIREKYAHDKPRVLLRVQNTPPTHFVLKSNFLLEKQEKNRSIKL